MLRPEFTVRRTGERYDRSEVDALVARIVATAERIGPPTVTVAELRKAAFSTPIFGAGYSAEEVDRFIADAERWMPDRTAPGGAPGVVPAPGAASAARVAPEQDVVPAPGVVRARPQQQAPSFTGVRFREGYDTEEVDTFVARLLATVNGQPVDRPVTAHEVSNVQFTPVRLREGYDVAEVDIFLETAESWLRQS